MEVATENKVGHRQAEPRAVTCLSRLVSLSIALTAAALVTAIMSFVPAWGLVLRGTAGSVSTANVWASLMVLYGFMVIPFFAVPVLAVAGLVLAAAAFLVGRRYDAHKVVGRAKLSMAVQIVCGLVWFGVCTVTGYVPWF